MTLSSVIESSTSSSLEKRLFSSKNNFSPSAEMSQWNTERGETFSKLTLGSRAGIEKEMQSRERKILRQDGFGKGDAVERIRCSHRHELRVNGE
jgi:hypothetical protein